MSMDYIRRHYSVPAKRGGKVKFQGKTGTILGAFGRCSNSPPRARCAGGVEVRDWRHTSFTRWDNHRNYKKARRHHRQARSWAKGKQIMCCHRQHLRARAWGYECIHCGTWLDIGYAPDKQEIADNCQPCCECAAKENDGLLN